MVGEFPDYILLYFDCGEVAVQRNGTSVMLSRETRESYCVKRAISRYVQCSPTLDIDPAAVPFVHQMVTEFCHTTVVPCSKPAEEAVRL
jgi:hypothetical protein